MAETLTAPAEAPPTFQPEDLLNLFQQDTFIQSPPEERQKMFNAVAGSAYQTLAGDPSFDRSAFKAWGEAVNQGRTKLNSMITANESIANMASIPVDLAKGLFGQARGAVTAIADMFSGADSEIGKGPAQEITQTFGADFVNGIIRAGDATRGFAFRGASLMDKNAPSKLLADEVNSLKSEIDKGNIPVSSDTFAPWIQGQSSKIEQRQAAWNAYYTYDSPKSQNNQAFAKRNSILGSPQNSSLLAQYIATRDPATWETLRSNLLSNSIRENVGKRQEAIDTSEGAKQYDAMFGEGTHKDLESASDPINLAATIFPAFKGLKAAEAVSAATKLGRVGEVALSSLKTAPVNFALGAAGALEQDPNARAGQVIKQGAETALGGAVIHTLTGTPPALLKRNLGTPTPTDGVSEARSPNTPPDAPVELQPDAKRTTSVTDDQAADIFGTKPDVRILGEEPVSQLSPPPNPDTPPPSEVQQHTASLADAQKDLESALTRGGNIEAAQIELDVATKRLEQSTAKAVEERPQSEAQVSEEERTAVALAQSETDLEHQTKEVAPKESAAQVAESERGQTSDILSQQNLDYRTRQQGVPDGAMLQDHLNGVHEVIEPPKPVDPVTKEAQEAKAAEAQLLGRTPETSAQESLVRSTEAQKAADTQKAALTQKVARGDAVSTDTVEASGVQTPPTYIPGSDGVSRNTKPLSYEGHLAVQSGHVPSPAEALPGEIASPEAQPDSLPPVPFTDFLRQATQGKWSEEAYRAAQKGETGDLSSTQRRILGRVEREFEDQSPEARQAARRAEAQQLREDRAGKSTVGSDLPPEGEGRPDQPVVETAADKPSGFTNLNVASKLFNESGATTIPHALYEAARWGAHRIQAGFRDFAEWSAEMVKKFGAGIKPHLNDLFSMSRDNFYELTGNPSPWTEVTEGYAEGLKDVSDSLRRRDANKMLTAQRDVVDDQSAYAGNRSANAVRQAFGYKENLPGGDRNPTNQHVDYDMRAAAFVLESGGDRALLSQQANDLRNAPKPKQYTQEGWDRFKNKWVPMLDYAVQHFDALNRRAQVAKNLLDMERASEVSVGLDVGEVDNYITHRYKNIAQMHGDPTTNGVFGGSGGSRFSKYFTKERTYAHLAQAMADGYDPTSTNVADLVGYRVKAGQTLVRQKQLENRLFNTRDSQTGDFLLKQVKPGDKSAPTGYARMNLAGSDSYVFKPYERVMKQLYGESGIRNSTIGNALLKTEGFIKHGNVVWDSYHAARVMFNQLAATGRVGWRKGYSLLEYTPHDLGNMLADGQITQEIHDYAVDPINQARTKNLISGGLVANRIIENLDADAVGWVRKAAKAIAGAPGDRLMEGVQNANHYIFQKLTRGSMIQTALSFTNRYVKQGLSEEAAASRAAKEVNEMFGNVGRQGWFRSQGARDLSQLLMFAPSWTNGRIAYELRAGGQMLSALKNGATLKKISLGNAAKTMGTTYLGALAAAQVINYATKGQSTFENDEGHKTMAWIPVLGSEKGGFYFDPLYFAAPVMAALAHGFEGAMSRGRTSPEATADAVGQLVGNKMSPLLRAALIESPIPGVGGKDYAGRPFKTATDRQVAAVANLLPTPIPLSSIVRDPSMKGIEKQVFSSVGVHLLPAPTATQQAYGLATPFRPKEDGAVYAPSKYLPVKQAVQDGNKDSAQQAMISLARQGETDLDKLDHEFGYNKEGEYKGRTFTGSHDRERQMLKTLNPDQLGIYQDAQKEQRDWAHTYHQWRNEVAPQIREATKAYKEEAKDAGIYVPKKLKRS